MAATQRGRRGQGSARLRLGQGADPAAAGARPGALAAGAPPPGRRGAGLLRLLRAGPHHPGGAGRGGRDALDGGVRLPGWQGPDRAGPLPGPSLPSVVSARHAGDGCPLPFWPSCGPGRCRWARGAAECAEVAELLVPLSVPEIRRLLAVLAWRLAP